VAAVLIGCFLLATLNGIWLLWLQSHNTEFRASPAYGDYLSRRALFSKPLSVISIFGLIIFGVVFIAKPHIEPTGEFDEIARLIILAILTCGGLGYLLSLLINL
jgi:O-antigen/teichoic acid export membrane protein